MSWIYLIRLIRIPGKTSFQNNTSDYICPNLEESIYLLVRTITYVNLKIIHFNREKVSVMPS